MKLLRQIVFTLLAFYLLSQQIFSQDVQVVVQPDLSKGFYFTSSGDIIAGGDTAGVYISSDDGIHWSSVDIGRLPVNDIIPDHFGGFYITTDQNHGTFYCPNKSLHCNPISKKTIDSVITTLSESPQGVLFACTEHGSSFNEKGSPLLKNWRDGLYCSSDKGATWARVSSFPYETAAAVAFDSAGILYVASAKYFHGGLFKSTDNGQSWSRLGIYNGIIAITPFTDSVVCLFNETGTYYSSNGGTTFTQVNAGLIKSPAYALNYLPAKGIYAISGNRLVFLPEGKQQWRTVRNLNEPLLAIQFHSGYLYAVTKNDNNTYGLYKISLDSLYYKQDLTEEKQVFWSMIGSIPYDNMPSVDPTISINTKGEVYYSKTFFVYVSKDTCKSWSTIDHVQSSERHNHFIVTTFSRDPKTDNLYAFDMDTLYESTDGGRSWEKIYISKYNETNNNIHTLSIFSNGILFFSKPAPNHDTLFVSLDKGRSWDSVRTFNSPINLFAEGPNGIIYGGQRWHGLFRLSPDHFNLTAINNGLPEKDENYLQYNNPFGPSIQTLAITSKGNILVSIGTNIFISNNNGDAWRKISEMSEYLNCMFSTSSGKIYAGTRSGVLESDDEGATWDIQNIGLTSSDIVSIFTYPDGFLYAISDDGKVYRSIKKAQ